MFNFPGALQEVFCLRRVRGYCALLPSLFFFFVFFRPTKVILRTPYVDIHRYVRPPTGPLAPPYGVIAVRCWLFLRIF